MRLLLVLSLFGALLLAASVGTGQPPPGGKKDKKGPGRRSDAPDLVSYLMSFDANKDGKLSREELTDTRLHRLFDRADTKKAGAVTREQLEAVAARIAAEDRANPPGFGGKKGPPPK